MGLIEFLNTITYIMKSKIRRSKRNQINSSQPSYTVIQRRDSVRMVLLLFRKTRFRKTRFRKHSSAKHVSQDMVKQTHFRKIPFRNAEFSKIRFSKHIFG
ncbi:hypothetical protein RF11_14740 [Thelohanellus kitauei]|uniref:Uncharacterized protein n=1 Tax=Thelohanellus kitauei TaxID=669202 RepID=A0A0C2ILK6_THEKT|nr:hypothetical protein RF11_14740 [Thelohanellus kitauei]